MKEIVDRLQENRQIELAKSILESNGYKVEKRLKENAAPTIAHELVQQYKDAGVLNHLLSSAENWDNPNEVAEEANIIATMLATNPENVYGVLSDDKFSIPMYADDPDTFDAAYDMITGDGSPNKTAKALRGDGVEVELRLFSKGAVRMVEEISDDDGYSTYYFAVK